MPAGSYRTTDFVDAARDLRVDLIVASDGDTPMGDLGPSRSLLIDFARPEWSVARIVNIKPRPDAVIAVDDTGVVIAAMASSRLGIKANPIAAIESTRDKAHMRGLLSASDVPQPRHLIAHRGDVPRAASDIGYPCVVKPRNLSASRGVIRIDDDDGARETEARIRDIIESCGGDPDETLLVESFVPGPEVAVEGMLVNGVLTILAILDKPDPLDGPFFEETMFVTPSRHDERTQDEISSVTEAAAQAMGLVSGPIHAEVRCSPEAVVVIEVAARSIGGLCGRALTFGLLGESLESVILRSALDLPGPTLDTSRGASGVLMLPIPRTGTLVEIAGVDRALEVDGIVEFDQTIPNGRDLVPIPEGDRYLGFLFATGESPEAVERSLRSALDELDIEISP